MSGSTHVHDLLGGDSKTWAILNSYLGGIVAIRQDDLQARSGREPFVPPTAIRRDGAMVIPVAGPLTRWPQRGLVAMLLGGGTAVEDVRDDLRAALADPGVGRIILHIDSPGGETDGVTELAREIYEARSRKPVTAFVDSMAASAAYWLASQASEVIVTPSGSVGSIGVFALHLDRSAQLNSGGIAPTFIQAGRFKTEENPLQPLGDAARAAVQSRVDAFYSMFTKDVARGRGVSVETVRSQFGEGRMVLARDAVKRGMADDVGSITRALAQPRTTASTRATDDGVPIAAETATVAFTYIETRDGGRCAAEARDAFQMAVLDLGLHARQPELRFFRAEDQHDRLFDTWSARMSRAQHEWAITFPDRRGGLGEIWVNAAIDEGGFMAHVVRHEVRHMVQSRTLIGDAAEIDAERYAIDRMTIIDSLYSGRRAS